MNILHVLNHSLPHTDGYCVRSACIVREQRRLGWNPVVLTSPRHEGGGDSIECIEGTRYHRMGLRGTHRSAAWERATMVRRMRKRLLQLIRAEQVDLIHAHSPSLCGMAALSVARKCRIPFVYEVRGLWEEGAVDQGRTSRFSWKYQLTRLLETRVARRADSLVVISEGLAREFESRGVPADRIDLVPNGVDVERFTPHSISTVVRERLGLGNEPVVAYIGSLYPWEGVDTLIEAGEQVLSEGLSLAILIVGDGECKDELVTLVRRRGLDHVIRLTGRVAHGNIGAYYSAADVIVYPRRRSRQMDLVTPLKPLEAAALGKAIVSSDVGGLRELLPEDTAVFFDPGDARSLARALGDLLRDEERRGKLGAAARRHVCATRSWSHIVRRYRRVYDRARRREDGGDRSRDRLEGSTDPCVEL